MPSMVKPVTQVIPLNAPRIITIKTAKTRLGIAASATRNKPDVASEAPNKRRRENCAKTLGPKAIPAARPVKTAPNKTPYAASPPPRSPTNVRARPITAPAATNAPTIPTIRPRMILLPETAFQPSCNDLRIPESAECFSAAPLGISRNPQIVNAAKANDSAFAYSARSIAVELIPKVTFIADVNKERKVNNKAAIGAVPYAASKVTWLAFSNRSRGTKLGTDASFAGDQNKVIHSTKIVAVYNQK